MNDPIRVLIADDHHVVRQGLAALLVPRNGFVVVGEAADGAQAILLARDLAPDVILMDMVMPGMDGPEAIAAIRDETPSARVLVLTSFGEADRVEAAIQAGAMGYLLKDSTPDELIHAIHSVHGGNFVLPQELAQALLRPQRQAFSHGHLTEREIDVLRLMARGLTNKLIAGELHIGATTVRSHVSSILVKLNASNRTQAVLIAQERHIL